MPISLETEAEVLRLYHAEGWRLNTIAKHFGIHHSTVWRVLNRNGFLPRTKSLRKLKIDPYIPFIKSMLEKYPKLNATRLFHMAKERGFEGGVDHFRDHVRRYRPRKAEAYLRLTTLPGEQAQVDWACFGKLKVGDAERRLLAFVMVLSWSRRIFLRFYFGDKTANFLRGHVEAFNHFNAVPREILYDNLKSAVLERYGNAIHFNPQLLALSGHYRFAPKPVAVARANEKGRVERAIQYVRSAFFSARSFEDIDDLNRQAEEWCRLEAQDRKCPQNKTLSVAEAFEKEKEAMLANVDFPFPVYDRLPVHVGKTPYVRFDLNDYSVPHNLVRTKLVVEATLDSVSITDGFKVVATHPRSFDKGKQIEDAAHINELVEIKRESSRHRGMNRLHYVVPSSMQFFKQAAERGHNMGRLTQLLIRLLDLYGASELEAALNASLSSGSIHTHAVMERLEKRRKARGLTPPVLLTFAKDKRINEVHVVPKPLSIYDNLLKKEEQQ